MARHTFNFDGGDQLTTISATWFVSYLFYELEDKTHRNWEKVSNFRSRISTFNRTREYHRYWLQQVLNMNDNNLIKNTINLKPTEIKLMAKKLLKRGC